MALQKTTDRVRGSCAVPRSRHGPRAGGAAPACMYNKDATGQVADGARVRVDGDAGTVTVLE